jgi:carbon monoxide dehydrogenase subunit G
LQFLSQHRFFGGGDILVRIEKSIEISAPPEKVWEMLALDRWSEWNLGHFLDTKNMKFTSEVNTPEDKFRVGASAYPSAHPKADFKVTESLEYEKITYLHGGEATMTYILKPTEEGTRLTYVVDSEFRSTQDKILMKMFGRLGERDVKRSLEKLKSIAEK